MFISCLLLSLSLSLVVASAHLGNANGNIYQSKAGAKGQHDGQVYVRLKKKRFVVLDYTIQPNETDLAQATEVPHMEIPSGAGKTQCITKECIKVGVPVKLYDSNPEDSVSLYLRSGMCFECQRKYVYARLFVVGVVHNRENQVSNTHNSRFCSTPASPDCCLSLCQLTTASMKRDASIVANDPMKELPCCIPFQDPRRKSLSYTRAK